MIALALILLALAALLTTAIVMGDAESLTLDLFGVDVGTSTTVLFLSGVAVGAAVLLAFALLRVGLAKGWRQHRRMRDLERRAEEAPPPGERIVIDDGLRAADDDRPREPSVIGDDDGTGSVDEPVRSDDPADRRAAIETERHEEPPR